MPLPTEFLKEIEKVIEEAEWNRIMINCPLYLAHVKPLLKEVQGFNAPCTWVEWQNMKDALDKKNEEIEQLKREVKEWRDEAETANCEDEAWDLIGKIRHADA